MSHLTSFAAGYLLNSLWQVPLLWLGGVLTARMARRLGPPAEHRVWSITLLLQCLLPACSLSPSSAAAVLGHWLTPSDPHRAGAITILLGPASLTPLHLSLLPLRAALYAYTAFLCYVLARLLWRFSAALALARSASAVPLDPDNEHRWHRCKAHFSVYRASLATSPRIDSPITLGLRRHLILLPANLLDRLRGADLDTVLAHELAHIARNDFAKNLLYGLVSLPVSYHPFVRRTRAHLTETREVVCDELAAGFAGRRAYAHSLLRLASLLAPVSPPSALHAVGILDANLFERRLMLLTEKPRHCHGPRRALIVATSTVFALATCATALALRITVNPTAEPTSSSSPAAASRPPKVSSDVIAGNLLAHVFPVYPEAAKKAKIQGAVVLRAIIGKDGTITDLKVLSGPKELITSSLDAVRQWTYKPYLLNGQPTEVETTITINYSLG